MLNEAARVCGDSRLGSEPNFEGSERTDETEPCFGNYNCDGCQVHKPEPDGVDPFPREKIAGHD